MDESRDSLSQPVPSVSQLRRLGRNINGYFGETIEVAKVLNDCQNAAHAHGWASETIQAAPGLELLALVRPARPPTPSAKRVYISTGIHGDEPAGPLAVCELLKADTWPANLALWMCPCLNPTGFAANKRENAAGADLNRQYLKPQAEEIIAHIAWLERQPRFDLCLCLHEDWESHGFYLYELNPDGVPSLGPQMIEKVAAVCPVDPSEVIEGRPARQGLIQPNVDPRSRPDWPEAFFLLNHKTRLSYTLEAPSDFPLGARVAALTVAVNAALSAFVGRAS